MRINTIDAKTIKHEFDITKKLFLQILRVNEVSGRDYIDEDELLNDDYIRTIMIISKFYGEPTIITIEEYDYHNYITKALQDFRYEIIQTKIDNPNEEFRLESPIIKTKYALQTFFEEVYLANKVYNNNHKLIVAILDDEKTTYYTATNDTIDVIKKIQFENGVIVKKLVESSDKGSDVSIAESVLTNKLQKLIVIGIPRKKHENLKGEFFPYLCKLPIDLSRYQIFNTIEQVTSKENKDNCLVHTLKQSGLFKRKTINAISKSIKSENFPLAKLKLLADMHSFGYEISTYNTGYVRTFKYKHNTDAKKVVKLCLVNGHYFIYDEKTDITTFAIKNYEKVKTHKKWNYASQFIKGEKVRVDKNRCTDSLAVVLALLDNKEELLTPIDLSKLKRHVPKSEEITSELSYTENDTNLIEFKHPKKNYAEDYTVVFYDTETITLDDDETPLNKHEAYQIRAINMNDDEVKKFDGKYCVVNFLKSLSDKTLLICHNLKYDATFIYKHLFAIRECTRGGKVITLNGMFHNKDTGKNIKICMKDSYAMIPLGLKEFPETFALGDFEKEVMPYGLYTENNLYSSTKYNKWISIERAKHFLEEEDHKQFENNIINLGLGDKKVNPTKFKIWEYSCFYCIRDVEIMKRGYLTMRKWILDITKLDILNYATISSIAYAYAKKEGCFEGCYDLGGIPRRFLMECVVGGRCMLKNNKKQHVKGNIQDFDGVSLYPSSMARLGVLKGKPKVLPKGTTYDDLQKYDGYFVRINVTKVNKELDFPLLSRKNKDGVREFRNDLLGLHYVDKYSLEDLIEYQKVECNIIDGYYFDEGRNYKIQELIKHLFETRAKEKRDKNPIQAVYKLLMNSVYGKSLLKYDPVETRYFGSEQNALRFIVNNYEEHIESVKLDGTNTVMVKSSKVIDDHSNFPQFGVEVLSMSKRIMNEVMVLAQDVGSNIYYQDTDSMHITANSLAQLEISYKEKFNRDLVGSKLGQFHCDFDYDTDYGTVPYSVEFIGLGKKVYFDDVVVQTNGVEEHVNHIKMKGVSDLAVNALSSKLNIHVKEIYLELLSGKSHKFNLLSGKVRFKHEKNKTVRSLSKFERELKF